MYIIHIHIFIINKLNCKNFHIYSNIINFFKVNSISYKKTYMYFTFYLVNYKSMQINIQKYCSCHYIYIYILII